MKRTVTQIATMSPSGNGVPAFVALCSDGSMWIMDDNMYQDQVGWLRLKDVPDSDIPEKKLNRFENVVSKMEPVLKVIADVKPFVP